MPVYDVSELVAWGKCKVMCPHCINGSTVKGWDKKYSPIRARVYVNRVVSSDAQGEIKLNIFQRVINCKNHGAVIVEEEM